jgi:polar amino acid transport system permease protein
MPTVLLRVVQLDIGQVERDIPVCVHKWVLRKVQCCQLRHAFLVATHGARIDKGSQGRFEFLVYFGLPGFGVRVSPMVAMMLSLGLIAGAYLAEVFRGALGSVDANETLAARAMGLTKIQIFLHIEFPQMMRFAFPGIVNEFTSVLKYSPFAYTVGIPEITKQAMSLSATTLRGVEIYLAVGFLYFAIYRVVLVGFDAVERRFRVPGIGPG